MKTRIEAARYWRDRKVSVIPVHRGTKRPMEEGWTRYCSILPTDDELADWFSDDRYEIAVVGGPAPLAIADFDRKQNPNFTDGGFLDHATQYPAITLLPRVRTGSGTVHVYGFADVKKFVMPYPDGNIEVRTGLHLTLTPPSRYKLGGEYRWKVEPEATLPTLDLAGRGLVDPKSGGASVPVKRPSSLSATATANIHPASVRQIVRFFAPHWQEGQRHAIALALSGWLATKGVSISAAIAIMEAIVEATGDDDGYDRLLTVETSYARFDKRLPLIGWQWLESTIGTDALRIQNVIDNATRRPTRTL